MIYTPENIQELATNEIFVFGSNESGIHGAGAARTALKFGAKVGYGFGPMGQTFAIPTKDWRILTLDLKTIEFYIQRFLSYAVPQPKKTFLVTKIGCGLAGYSVEEIGALFPIYTLPPNIILPREFWEP